MLLILAAVLTGTLVAAEAPSRGGDPHTVIVGAVTLTDARGETFDAPGVDLTLTCGRAPDETWVAVSDEHGAFRFEDPPDDHCSITADLQGFANATTTAVVRPNETLNVAIHLDAATVGTAIDVVAGSSMTLDQHSCTKCCRRSRTARSQSVS
jgi:hypothetical protein